MDDLASYSLQSTIIFSLTLTTGMNTLLLHLSPRIILRKSREFHYWYFDSFFNSNRLINWWLIPNSWVRTDGVCYLQWIVVGGDEVLVQLVQDVVEEVHKVFVCFSAINVSFSTYLSINNFKPWRGRSLFPIDSTSCSYSQRTISRMAWDVCKQRILCSEILSLNFSLRPWPSS